MKASYFCNCRYLGQVQQRGWPVPADDYRSDEATRSFNTWLSRAKLADENGFDWVSVAEHHFAPFSMAANPMVMAGAITQLVKRAKIALLGPDVPILNPVRLAEEFAMLDTMTGGRVVAGMMRGTPNEYVTYNINPNESRERFNEALKLIQTCWTEKKPFGWQGRYYQYRAISIWPRPVQAPHMPIYMSGSSPEAGSFAAQNGYGVGFAVTTVPKAARAAAHYREEADKAGWTPDREKVVYRISFHVAETDEQAVNDLVSSGNAKARAGISAMNREVFAAIRNTAYYSPQVEGDGNVRHGGDTLEERIELGQLLAGSPQTVLGQIRRIKEALDPGVLDVTVAGEMGEATERSIALMGQEVVPAMHAL